MNLKTSWLRFTGVIPPGRTGWAPTTPTRLSTRGTASFWKQPRTVACSASTWRSTSTTRSRWPSSRCPVPLRPNRQAALKNFRSIRGKPYNRTPKLPRDRPSPGFWLHRSGHLLPGEPAQSDPGPSGRGADRASVRRPSRRSRGRWSSRMMRPTTTSCSTAGRWGLWALLRGWSAMPWPRPCWACHPWRRRRWGWSVRRWATTSPSRLATGARKGSSGCSWTESKATVRSKPAARRRT